MFLIVKFLCILGLAAFAFADKQPWTDVASDASGKYLAAVATDTYTTSKVLISDDYGVSWKYTNSMSAHWYTIYSDPTGKTLVAGSGCDANSSCPGAYYSNDRGNTWTKCTGFDVSGIKPYFSNDAIAGDATGTNLWTNMYLYLFHSGNGGKSWSKISNLPYVYGDNAGDAVTVDGKGSNVVGVSEGYIVTSTNGGSSWTKGYKYQPTDGSWRNFVSDSSGQYVYAATDYTFYRSADYGRTWTSIKAYPHYDGRFKQLKTDSTGESTYIVDTSMLYKYSRSTGTYQSINGTTGFSTISGSSNCQYLIAGIAGGNLYRSTDYGKTWSISY
jgi:photosystem II stability/assembly factor-like uncharacterized protein